MPKSTPIDRRRDEHARARRRRPASDGTRRDGAAPNACATSGSRPSSRPIANTATAKNSMLARPTAPIAFGAQPADHDRVDDAHRHPAELRHHDRRGQREHGPELAPNHSRLDSSGCRRFSIAPRSSHSLTLIVLSVSVMFCSPLRSSAAAARRRCRCSRSRSIRRRCRRTSGRRGKRRWRTARARLREGRRDVDAILALARAQMRARPRRRLARDADAGAREQAGRAAPSLERGRGLIVIRKFELAMKDLRKAAETLPGRHCALGSAQYLAADYRTGARGARQMPGPRRLRAISPARRAGGDRRCRRRSSSRDPAPDPSRRSGCPARASANAGPGTRCRCRDIPGGGGEAARGRQGGREGRC